MSEPKDARLINRHLAAQRSPDRSRAVIDVEERAALGHGRSVGRPSVVERFRTQLVALLEAEPRVKTVEVLQRMRQAGYAGGKSVLYEMVRVLRPRDVSPLALFADRPGVVSQHDFGAVMVSYLTGGTQRIPFFASRLEYSRYVDVRLVRDRGIESLVRSLLAGFEAFGGVPLMAVFENPRTLTVAWDGSRIEWNEILGQVAVDYRFAPEMFVADGSHEKNLGGDLLDFVKDTFFRVRRFRDRDDLVGQFDDWHREVNTARPQRATEVPPIARLAAERERLRSLAIPPAEYALRFPVVVGRAGLVEFHGHRYAMPREAIGIPGLLWLYPEYVRIVAGRYLSEQARVHEYGSECTHAGRRSPRSAMVAGARGRPHVKRPLLPEIVEDHRLTWKTEVE